MSQGYPGGHQDDRPSDSSDMSVSTVKEDYTYLPLSGNASIRLLTILPCDDTTDLHLELDEVKVDDKPEFEALSYAWGELDFSAAVYLERGQSRLRLTHTLESALRRLRYPRQPRVIWVDAICIDQHNAEERGHQVSLMSRVFRTAKKVLVWLGDGDADTHAAFECLEDLARTLDFFEVDWDTDRFTFFISLSSEYLTEWLTPGVVNGIIERAGQGRIAAVLQRQWFKRLWIIQEIFLASTATVLCGADAISWGRFATSLQLVDKALDRIESPSSLGHLDSEEFRMVIRIANARSSFRQWSTPCALVVEPWDTVILDLYETFRNQQCHDDRDRVYGFLALRGPEHELDFSPNYLWTVEQTYKEFALGVHHVCRNLLGRAGLWCREASPFQDDISHPNHLPSWAPDYRPITGSSRLAETLRRRHFKTASNTEGITYFGRSTENILVIRGKIFDSLLMLGLCGPDFGATVTLSQALWNHYYSLELERYPSGGDALPAFLQTVTTGDKTIPIHRLEALWKSFVKVASTGLGPLRNDETTLTEWVTFNNIMIANVKDDSVVVTKKGFFGRVPFATQFEDHIAIVAGEDTPMVVRWAENLHAYRLVGPCYIHGLMEEQDGNPIDEDFLDEWIPLA